MIPRICGIGFIKRDDGGSDVFLHAKAMANRPWDMVNEGDVVEFEIVKTARGNQAENVRVI